MQNIYDVAVVGTGPAGFMAALALLRLAPGIKIIMFEKGPVRGNVLAEGQSLTEGWGGAGAFSDGKFNDDTTGQVGGRLVDLGMMTPETWARHCKDAGALFIEFGGDSNRQFGRELNVEQRARLDQLKRMAMGRRTKIHEFPILHLGTSTAHQIVENIRAYLLSQGAVIMTDCYVNDFQHNALDGYWKIGTSKGDSHAKRVICCPGRSGAQWFQKVAPDLGISLRNNGVDIGVRVEVNNDVMSELTSLLYEAKLYHRTSTDARVRSFCMCPSGHVAREEYRDSGIFCANGHTDNANLTGNTNFAVLVTQIFTAPFKDPHRYAAAIAHMHNELAGDAGLIVQRLGDLRNGRRSTPHRLANGFVRPTCDLATPGNLGLAMPANFITALIEFMDAMNVIAPGVGGADTLFYGPEIKWNAVMADADPTRGFEALPGFYVAGDGTGYTRGLNGAAVMGLNVGLHIASIHGADITGYRNSLVDAGALAKIGG